MIDSIETAILARLHAASVSGALGYTIPTIGRYQGELTSRDALTQLSAAMPSVLSLHGGLWASTRGSHVRYLSWWTLLLGTNISTTGNYQLQTDICALLANQTFGLPVAPLQVLSTHLIRQDVVNAQPLSIYGLNVQVAYDQGEIPVTFPSDLSPGFGLADLPSQPSETPSPPRTGSGRGLGDFHTLSENWALPASPASDEVTIP